MKTHLSAAIVLAFGVFVGGCDSKLKECNQVADIVNANVDALHGLEKALHATTDPTEEAKQAKAMVDTVQDASRKLNALEIRTEGLKPLLAAYIEMLGKIEEGGRDILSQVEGAGSALEAKVEVTLKSLQDAQEDIVKACDKPSPDCEKVVAVINKFPSNPNEEQLVQAFSQMGADLDKLELKDGSLKSATEKFSGVVKEKVVLLEKALQLQKALESAEKKIDDAVAAEDKVVDELNSFCGAS